MKISIDVRCLSNKAYQCLQQAENPQALIEKAIEAYIADIPSWEQKDIRDILLRIEQKIDGLYDRAGANLYDQVGAGHQAGAEQCDPASADQPLEKSSKRASLQQHIPSEKPIVESNEKPFDAQQAVDDLAKALDFFS